MLYIAPPTPFLSCPVAVFCVRLDCVMVRLPQYALYIAPPTPSCCPVPVFCVRLDCVMVRVPPSLYIAPPYPLFCCPIAVLLLRLDCVMLRVPLLYIAPPTPMFCPVALFCVRLEFNIVKLLPVPLLTIAPPSPLDSPVAVLLLRLESIIVMLPLLLFIAPPYRAVLFLSVLFIIVKFPPLSIAPPYPLLFSAFIIVMFLRITEDLLSIQNICFWFPSMVLPLPSMVIVIALLKSILPVTVYVFLVSVMVVSCVASVIVLLSVVHESTVVSFFRLLPVVFSMFFYQIGIRFLFYIFYCICITW